MKKILIVEARYYENISQLLLEGAVSKLRALNYEYEILTVFGSLEIPQAIKIASKNNKYDAFIAVGCIIRGETSHYDIVANETARALMSLSINENLIITNAILTTENEEQAIVRADKTKLDKAGFAVLSANNLIKIKYGAK